MSHYDLSHASLHWRSVRGIWSCIDQMFEYYGLSRTPALPQRGSADRTYELATEVMSGALTYVLSRLGSDQDRIRLLRAISRYVRPGSWLAAVEYDGYSMREWELGDGKVASSPVVSESVLRHRALDAWESIASVLNEHGTVEWETFQEWVATFVKPLELGFTIPRPEYLARVADLVEVLVFAPFFQQAPMARVRETLDQIAEATRLGWAIAQVQKEAGHHHPAGWDALNDLQDRTSAAVSMISGIAEHRDSPDEVAGATRAAEPKRRTGVPPHLWEELQTEASSAPTFTITVSRRSGKDGVS